MAWNPPKTWAANEVLTAEDLNLYLRDNLNECAPAKALHKGSWFVGDGPNAIVERVPKFAGVSASEQTGSTTYVDLETIGPSVTTTTGSRALIFLSCAMTSTINEGACFMSFAISGATTQSASSTNSLWMDGISKDKANRKMQVFMEEDLIPGENTFTCKYQVGSQPATFSDRFIAVWPF